MYVFTFGNFWKYDTVVEQIGANVHMCRDDDDDDEEEQEDDYYHHLYHQFL